MYHPEIATETQNRARTQPPKKVWMDAIINKSRSAEPSPSNHSAVGPPHSHAHPRAHPHAHGFAPPSKHTRMLVTADDGTTWHPLDQAPPPPPPMVDMRPVHRSSRSPSPVVTATALQALSVEASAVAESRYAEQLSLDHSALETLILKALKDMVADQDCCFIARGECHLCAGTNLVPVVNFCPDFSPTHSLCREHLRSMHRVRLEDIFAGKNQPTVSKRALRCTVCALSCPCSKCQLARDSEIAKYKQWLASPSHSSAIVDEPASDRPGSSRSSDSEMDPNGRSAARPRPRERTPPPPPLPPSSAMPRDDARHGDDNWNGNGVSRRQEQGNRRSASVESTGAEFSPPHAEDKYDEPDRRGYYAEEKPVDRQRDGNAVGYGAAVEAPSGLPLMPLRADEKKPVRVNRVPKRAAKESVPYQLDTSVSGGYASRGPTPRERLLGGGGNDVTPAMASPSAASVLNCPDSEKSLVDLLSSLNQQITPAVRFFADEEEPPLEEAAPSSSSHEDNVEPSGPSRPNGREGSAVDSFEAPDAAVRRQKRKREGAPSKQTEMATSSSRGDGKDDATSEKGSVDGENGGSTYRQKAPAPLTTSEKKAKPQQPLVPPRPPSPSPRGRPSSRPKAVAPPPPEPKTSSRKREAPSDPIPTPPGSTRRRKTEAAPVARAQSPAAERKTARGPDHRGHAHKPAKAQKAPREEGRGRKKKAKRVDEDSDEDVRYIPGEDEDDEDLMEEGGEDDEEDDDELDTNLDYCEVCLAAGDLVCCDICPRSFHLKCLKMTEDDLPEGDWQCAECKKPSYFESFAVSVAEKTTVPAKCLQIVQCLKSHPFAKQFLLPVENVPHYTAVVKQPMDLTTIEKKILDGKYMVSGKGTLQGGGGASKILHLGSFAEDVRLVWGNCKLFNDDGSGITRAADHLSEGFEKLYQHVLNFVERSTFAPKSSSQPRREEKKSISQAKPADVRAEASAGSAKAGLSKAPGAKAVDQAKAAEQTKDSSSKGVATTPSPPAPNAEVKPPPMKPVPGVGTSSSEVKPVAKEGVTKDSAIASALSPAQLQDKSEPPASKVTNSGTAKTMKPTSTPTVPKSTSPALAASTGTVNPSPRDSTTTTFVDTTATTKSTAKPLPTVDGGANAADPVKAPISTADKSVPAPPSEEKVPPAATAKPTQEAAKERVV